MAVAVQRPAGFILAEEDSAAERKRQMHQQNYFHQAIRVISRALASCALLSVSACADAPDIQTNRQETPDDLSPLKSTMTHCGDLTEEYGAHRVTFPEEYNFAKITERLAKDPELADFVGLSSVSDCDSARAFMEAQKAFLETKEQPVNSPWEGLTQKTRGGIRSDGHRGSVTIEVFVNGAWEHNCTGAMIGRNIILTAAHCLSSAGTQNFTIRYFDPSAAAKVRVTDWNELLDVFRDPSYAGTGDTVNDLGVIRRQSGNWLGTDAGDYLRIFAGLGEQIGTTRIWSAGIAWDDGAGSGLLRYADFPIVSWGPAHKTQATATLGVCAGDSGSPLIKTLEGNELIVSVHSSSDRTGWCAQNGAEQRHARVPTAKVSWIQSATGVSCSWLQSSGGINYRQCWQ